MTEPIIHIEDDLREAAKSALERARTMARIYDGAEDSYNDLLNTLSVFEECAKEIGKRNNKTTKNHADRCALEKAVSLQAQPDIDSVSIYTPPRMIGCCRQRTHQMK